ncbi:MAG: DUF4388 domain-containing protein [Actinobacteria bacterium]|nr:MAG: DUF4388 domain-containing protein [Actinomycetota bacterium]
MALKGKLEDFALPAIFQLIEASKKTGTLLLESGQDKAAVLFKEGKVFYANIGEDSLANRLVKANIISESTLKFCMQEKEKQPRSLSDILVKQNFLGKEELASFLKNITKESLSDILSWVEGDFDFEAGSLELGLDVSDEVVIDWQEAYGVAQKKLKQWEELKKVIPSIKAVVNLCSTNVTAEKKVTFSASEWKVVANVDGNRSVADICDISSMDKLSCLKILASLIKKQLVTINSEELDAALEEQKIEELASRPEEEKVPEEIGAQDDFYSDADFADEEDETVMVKPKFDAKEVTKNIDKGKDFSSMSSAFEELTDLSKEGSKENKAEELKKEEMAEKKAEIKQDKSFMNKFFGKKKKK